MSGHHPSETTLLSVAAGILEAAGDSMLDDLPPTPVAPDALDRIMTRLDRDPEPMPRTVAVAAPSNLAELATGRWRWCGAGIHMMPLIKCDATDTRLDPIRVGRGMALLEHGHADFERPWCCRERLMTTSSTTMWAISPRPTASSTIARARFPVRIASASSRPVAVLLRAGFWGSWCVRCWVSECCTDF